MLSAAIACQVVEARWLSLAGETIHEPDHNRSGEETLSNGQDEYHRQQEVQFGAASIHAVIEASEHLPLRSLRLPK
jgi:hypothetical protein